MTIKDLKSLINQKENAKLDFKREWYWSNGTSKQDIQKKKLELYKDLIAMTNGNIHYIDKPTYLIIGVKEGMNTPNEIYHVDFDVMALQQEIIQNVNNYVTPLIQDLTISKHIIEEKDIYVIEIPPHPFPIILKQDLKGLEKKGTLFIRAGEGTVVVDGANYETRKAFEEAVNRFYGVNKNSIIQDELKENLDISLAWHIDVANILKTISRQYIINTDKDWFSEENVFISKYSQKKIAIFCTLSEPSKEEVSKKILFSQSHTNNKLDKLIVVVKNVNKSFNEEKILDINIEYRYKNELLDNLVDFTDYYDYINKAFEEQEISGGDRLTLEDVYTKSQGEVHISRTQINSIESVEDYLFDWVNVQTTKQISLLGEYGQGKSVLSLKLAYEMIKNDYDRIPIIIELRGKSPRNDQIDDIISSWAKNYRIDTYGIMRLMEEGKLLIILEGFDEIDMVGDSNRRLEHFNRLWEFAEYENSKVIMTGRPNLFLDDEEMNDYLKIYQNDTNVISSEAIHIKPFNHKQIAHALRNSDANVKEEILELLNNELKSNSSFEDLMSRPSTLYQASIIWNELDKENINSALVIEKFLNHAYKRQEEKLRSIGRRGVESLLTTNERKYFMTGIAVAMVQQYGYTNQIDINNLKKIVEKLYLNIPKEISFDHKQNRSLKLRMKDNKDALESILNDIRASTILVRDFTQTNSFKFAHKSFLEYLTAKYFYEFRLQKMKSSYLDKNYKYYIEGIDKKYVVKIGSFVEGASILFLLDMIDESNINCKNFFNIFSVFDKMMMHFTKKWDLSVKLMYGSIYMLVIWFILIISTILLPIDILFDYLGIMLGIFILNLIFSVGYVILHVTSAFFDLKSSLYLEIKNVCQAYDKLKFNIP